MSEAVRQSWRDFVSGYQRVHVYTADPGAHAMARELVPIIAAAGRSGSWFADGWSAKQADACRPARELSEALAKGDTLILGSQTDFARTQAVIRQAAIAGASTVFMFDHWKNYAEHFEGGTLPDAIIVPDAIAREKLIAALGSLATDRVKVLPHLAIAAATERIAESGVRPERGLIAALLDPTEAADGLGYDWRKALAAMVACAAQRNDVCVVVRPHPRHDAKAVVRELAALARQGVPVEIDTGDLETLIARATEVWGMTTVGLNVALAAGKTIKSFQIGRNAAGAQASNPHIEPFVLSDADMDV